MNDNLDTMMNVTVFGFIGLLIWLYLKPVVSGSGTDPDVNNKQE